MDVAAGIENPENAGGAAAAVVVAAGLDIPKDNGAAAAGAVAGAAVEVAGVPNEKLEDKLNGGGAPAGAEIV